MSEPITTSRQAQVPGAAGHASSEERPDVADRSVGSLVSDVVEDLSTLMRQELALAKAEVRQEVKKGGAGAGMLAGAGVAGHLLLIFVSLALTWLLAEWVPFGWAALIVAVIWGVIAAVLLSIGRSRLRQVSPVPEQTVETVKEDVQWAKNRTS